MKYISTRDNKKTYNFVDTFLNGLAHDGGLYIPKKILRLSKSTLKRLSKLNYNDLAYEIIKYLRNGLFIFIIFSFISQAYSNCALIN